MKLTDHIARAANVKSNFNTDTNPATGGYASLEFTAVNVGTAGNNIQLVVSSSDHTNQNMVPTINVAGTTILVDLNTEDGYHTRA